MNLAAAALKKRAVMLLMTAVFIIVGTVSYFRLGKLEYPSFIIKKAMVITPYPGAAPLDVEREVTDKLEEAIQSMEQLESVVSTSQEGLSTITVEIKPEYHAEKIPQIWDELRRKVNDASEKLPEGVRKPVVIDDFSDVYGIFFAVTGADYNLEDLRKYAAKLKKELLLIDGVAKIAIWGDQREAVYVEVNRNRLTQLGIYPTEISKILSSQNLVEESGKVIVGDEFIRLIPTGALSTEEAIKNLYIRGEKGNLLQLKDIAQVYLGYKEPPERLLRFNGKPAVGIAISTEKGCNVVNMGKLIKQRLKDLTAVRPLGIELHIINYQSDNVLKALDEFLINLLAAVMIVILLLLIFMGLRSGLIIGFILLLTILGSFIGMRIMGIELQLISLGALVLALGMLVDNAIVVADCILVKIESGMEREAAALEAAGETQWPLLGATMVAILAFTPIGFNPGNAGEFCRSLFYVMAISLLLSWGLAITLTPLLCVWFLKPATGKVSLDDRIHRAYKWILEKCLRHWCVTGLAILSCLMLSIFAFQFIPTRFFSKSTRNQFLIDYWRSESTHISKTEADIAQIENYIMQLPEVKSVTSFIGEGTLRFVLTYKYLPRNSSFGQMLVTVKDYRQIKPLIDKIDKYINRNFIDIEPKIHTFSEGPPVDFGVEARFRGPNKEELLHLASQAKSIIRCTGLARDLRDDWRQPVKYYQLKYSEAQARRTGVTRSDLSQSLQWEFSGLQVGTYRENDKLLPILSRPPIEEKKSVENLAKVQVWSSAFHCSIPLSQVVESIKMTWITPLIKHRNRERTITVQCNPVNGMASTLLERVRPEIEALPLPPGYSLEWGGEYEESAKGEAGIKKIFPICLLFMFIIVAFLFKTLREPLIIFLCLPLAISGVSAGLLIFGLSFGFMAILGFLGLSGMLIKNAIVLLDQINLERESGIAPYQALIHSSVSRLRPVTMAAGTTIMGMIPLTFHPFFSAMAATIMCGLLVATILTLLVVPVMYMLFFRVPKPD
ncbi:MAG: efflux RND transporter permease subunit [Victivallaceae bacterium]|nr:efflux RND transporter permease subunit [Victivallaceae bacterium]